MNGAPLATNVRSGTLGSTTSQGSAYSRFRRALLTKNQMIIDAAAAEVGRLTLEDALTVLVVMAEKRDPLFERTAARPAARVTLERRLDPSETLRVLALAESHDGVAILLWPFCGA